MMTTGELEDLKILSAEVRELEKRIAENVAISNLQGASSELKELKLRRSHLKFYD